MIYLKETSIEGFSYGNSSDNYLSIYFLVFSFQPLTVYHALQLVGIRIAEISDKLYIHYLGKLLLSSSLLNNKICFGFLPPFLPIEFLLMISVNLQNVLFPHFHLLCHFSGSETFTFVDHCLEKVLHLNLLDIGNLHELSAFDLYHMTLL